MNLPMAELIKLAKMAGVTHEADHAYSIQSTWRLHQLATDVPFIACAIDSPCTFTCYLALSNFISESGLSYFRVLTICLLLVYFVSAAERHFFFSIDNKKSIQGLILHKIGMIAVNMRYITAIDP